MRLKKSLSQVFLTNRAYLEKIAHAIDVDGATVVEIGPGSGRATGYLLQKAKKVYAVDADERMCELLRVKFSDPRLETVHADILSFTLPGVGEKLVVYGNIPYSLSKKIVEYLITNRAVLKRAYILCQKEFAAKLTAKAGSEAYGFLSCYAQYYARVKKVLDVPRAVFSPPPKVDSVLVELDFSGALVLTLQEEGRLMELLRLAFGSSRKQIGATLRALQVTPEMLAACGIVGQQRPAEVTLAQYLDLARSYFKSREK